MAGPEESGRTRRRRSLGRALRACAVGVGLVALAYAATLTILSTAEGEAWLRARLESTLRPRLGHVALGEVGVDWRLRVRARRVHVPPRGDRLPAVDVDLARASVSPRALLAGRVAPGTVALRGVRVSGLAVRPLDVDLDLQASSAERLEATLRLASGGHGALSLASVPGGVAVRAAASVRAEELLVPGDRQDGTVTSGELALELAARASSDLTRAEGRLRARASGVFLGGRHAGAEPLGPLSASVALDASWDGATRRLRVAQGTLDLLDRAPLSFEAELGPQPDLPFSLAVRAERLDFGALLDALPPGLAPPAGAPRPAGTLDARLDLAGPLSDPAAWSIAASLDLARLREAGRRAPSPLRAPFLHAPDPSEPARAFLVGPANPGFVPIGELPEHVVRAVTTSEDAGFFAHAGFDFDELKNAFAAGAEKGRIVRGGSTITQQVAKNLFLSPERTLSRKAREALLAVALEATLPKRRILEIYLNVAEWGPGLWGIGPAARHWFGKDARELTPKEAAFLASVIPSPVRYHAMRERGEASDAWEARVNGILVRMGEQGALSADELAEGLAAPISFSGG